jgi:Ca2+-binding RTX toxin-like protein
MRVLGTAIVAMMLAITATETAGARELDPCFGGRPNIVGTEGDDNLQGTSGPDVIFGAGGDDTIIGGDGDDRICSGTGDDVIKGDGGNDSLFGATGVDFIYGGDGGDELYSGGSSTSELEYLDGGSGDDKLSGESSPEEMYGGIGDDLLNGGGSLLNVLDELNGDADDDELRGAQALLAGGQGDDYVEGGTLSFRDSLGPIKVDLSDGRAVGEGDDTFDSVFDVVGSRFDDEIIGARGDNHLEGGPGNDVIDGDEGTDVVDGGEGDDTCAEEAESTDCEAIGTVAITATESDQDPSGGVVIGAIVGGVLVLGGVMALMFRVGRKKAAAPPDGV